MKYIQSGKLLQIKNIKDKLMGLHDVGFRSPQYPSSIEFLWVDEHIEGLDSQYRIGFNYEGTEYSTYLHRYPQTPNHYYMGCYGPNMVEYRIGFNYRDFLSPNRFILSLIRQIDSYVNN
jgi:hypothetical protein